MRTSRSLRSKVSFLLLAVVATFGALWWMASAAAAAGPLPVKDPAQEGIKSITGNIRNLIDIGQIYAAVKDGDDKGLLLDLTGITTLAERPLGRGEALWGKPGGLCHGGPI